VGDFDVEIDSIRATVSWMDGNVIDTATKLRDTMKYLNSYAASGDWSSVPSCAAYGASYNAAMEAYNSVAEDLLSDAQKMRDALSRIADDYENADASSRAAFDAAIAGFVDAGYLQQSAADTTYHQHRGDLTSDNPEAAPTADGDAGTNGGSAPQPPATTTTGGGRTRIQ
jgi:hypothetical protein